MSFRCESDMLPPVQAWLVGQVPLVKAEFRAPWGYCDLVGCALNLNRVRTRIRLHQRKPIGSLEKVDLLWQIPNEDSGASIAVEELAARYSPWLDMSDVLSTVAALERRNFVVRTHQGYLQKRNGWFPLHRRLIAVELKLARVEEVMLQAKRHLVYADESYIALPLHLARNLSQGRRGQQLREMGIGLLGTTADQTRVYVKSRNNTERDPVLQAHCVERFWKLHLRDNSA